MGSVGKRVLIIVQNLPVPFDRRVWLEATTLAGSGYKVSVICPKLKGFNKSREHLEGVDVYRYAMPFDATSKFGFMTEFAWAWLATAWLSIKVAVFGRGFDVIHACNPPETYWALAQLWKLGGKRFIFDHHDLSPEMYQAKFGGDQTLIVRLLRFMERRSYQTADVVITTNESYRRIATTRGGVLPQDVFVVRSGPSLQRFERKEVNPRWAKGKKHVITYLGEITAQDGVDGLVRIVKHLSRRRDDFHVLVIGGGPVQPDIKGYAEEIGIGDRFTFTGDVIDDDLLSELLSSASVAVDTAPKNPWTDKSTMNKIMEYMFFGLPIVSYSLSETTWSAMEAVAAVERDSEEEFARVLSELLDDEQRRRAMSAYGRRRLVEQLSWENSVPKLLEAYERALSRVP